MHPSVAETCNLVTDSESSLELASYKKVKQLFGAQHTYVDTFFDTFKSPYLYYVDSTKRSYQEGVKLCQQKQGRLPEVDSLDIDGLRQALVEANQGTTSVFVAVQLDSRAKVLRYQGSGDPLPPLLDKNNEVTSIEADQIANWADTDQCLTLAPSTNLFTLVDCAAEFPTVCAPIDDLKTTLVTQAAASSYAALVNRVQLDEAQAAVEALVWDSTPCPTQSNETISLNQALNLWFAPDDDVGFSFEFLTGLWPLLVQDLQTLEQWEQHLGTYTFSQESSTSPKCICASKPTLAISPELPTDNNTDKRPDRKHAFIATIRDLWATVSQLLEKVTKLGNLHNIGTNISMKTMPTLNDTSPTPSEYYYSINFWVDLSLAAATLVGMTITLTILLFRCTCRQGGRPTNQRQATVRHLNQPTPLSGGTEYDDERRVRFNLSGSRLPNDDDTESAFHPRTRNESTRSSLSSLSQDSTSPWYALLERLSRHHAHSNSNE